MTKLNLRLLFSILAMFAVMAFAVACGDDDDDDDTGDDDGTPVVTAPKGTITIGATQFETWDPHFSNFAQDIEHFFMVWRGLYQFDHESKPIPSMAEGEPQVTDGGKTYTIKLKSGLKWSDGQPLTAKDFVLGMQRTCNPDIAGHYQYIMTAVAGCDDYYAAVDKTPAEKEALLAKVGVRAVDDATVEYKLREAQPTFPILLAMWPAFPVPSHQVAKVDAAWPDPLSVAYNGPFMASAYIEKDHLDLVPNPNWAGAEKPKVEKIVLRYIDDPAVINNAYRSGELDAGLANASELDKLKTEFPKELQLYPATRTIGIEYNLKDATMSKTDVRLALSQATDRETMMRVVFQNGNTATTNWMPPERSGLAPDIFKSAIGFDATKAKASLKKAGYDNGAGFPSVTLLLTDTATNQAAGAFLQAEWKKHLNIDIKLEFVDSKTRSARFNAIDYQLVLGGWQEDYPDPENWFLGLWETGGSINKTNTSVKAIDDLVAKAKFNQNDEERRKQYQDAEKLLVEQVNGIAPIYHTQAKFLVKPYIKGMTENKRPGDTFVPGGWDPEFWSTSK